MADEPTGDGTTEEPGTKDDPGTATTTDDGQGDDPELSSGDDLAKVRAEAARFRREARDWKKKAEDAARERDAATTTAEERLAKLEASERRNARATIERLAVAAGFHAGEPAHELDELAGLLAEDGGEAQVATRLATIAKARPYLVAPARDGRVLTPGRQSDVDPAATSKDAWLRS